MIHIAIASDNNYIPFVGALLASIRKTCDHPITIHLLNNGIDCESINLLRYQINSYPNWVFKPYDISNIQNALTIDNPSQISLTSYARLYLGVILPEDVEKVLYLDCDTIVCSDISELYNMSLDNNYIAGVMDIDTNTSKHMTLLDTKEYYFNAGVLLINLSLWRKDNLLSLYLRHLSDNNGNVYHHDQGIINYVCRGRKKLLPLKYNVVTGYYDFSHKELQKKTRQIYSPNEIREGLEVPVIVHFTPSLSGRPWNKGCRHPKRQLFWEALNNTAWKNTITPRKVKVHIRLLSKLHQASPIIYQLLLSIRHRIFPNRI